MGSELPTKEELQAYIDADPLDCEVGKPRLRYIRALVLLARSYRDGWQEAQWLDRCEEWAAVRLPGEAEQKIKVGWREDMLGQEEDARCPKCGAFSYAQPEGGLCMGCAMEGGDDEE